MCAIPSHDPRPMMLRNLYGIDLGTSGLILKAQSREEILADKIIALASRENRIKNRDHRLAEGPHHGPEVATRDARGIHEGDAPLSPHRHGARHDRERAILDLPDGGSG